VPRIQPDTPPSAKPRKPSRSPRPRIAGPLEAFLRHPFLTLLPMIVLVAGAAVLGFQRDPEYTSKARISVGTTDVNPFLLQEVVSGNQALAASYSRAIATADVVTAAAAKTGLAPATAADRLGASPVIGTTLIQVTATGPSRQAAVALANAGAQSLIAYVRSINRTNDAGELFKQYQKAQALTRRLERRTQALIHSRKQDSPAITRARIKQDAADLKATDLANRYRAASGTSNQVSQLALLAPAANAESDRQDVITQLILVAAVGGLVLGFTLVLLLANWRILRALREA
jgi:capsular polysaccharide biosynthesis protein